jgi:hypothetical protein
MERFFILFFLSLVAEQKTFVFVQSLIIQFKFKQLLYFKPSFLKNTKQQQKAFQPALPLQK